MPRAKKLTSGGKDTFVEAVLEMLDEGVGLRDLNLRRIAARIGCAHTNAYNYFGSFEELLWWSLRGALERMTDGAGRSSGDLIDVYVDFALDHPTWYRLIWVEPLAGPAPAEVERYLRVPAEVFAAWAARDLWRGGPAPSEPELATRVLHGYLHGELSAITSGRVRGDRDELAKRVREGATLLVDAITETAKRPR